MTATEVIEELKTLPREEREKVYRWFQQDGLQDLWPRADALMEDAPRYTEEEILNFPRVRLPH